MNLSLFKFLKNLYCGWKSSGTTKDPHDYYREASAENIVVEDTPGAFGPAMAEYALQDWADNVGECLYAKATYYLPLNLATGSIDFDLDNLAAPNPATGASWITDATDLKSIVIDDDSNSGEEIGINNIRVNGRVWTVRIRGLLNTATQNVYVHFEKLKSST